MEEKVRSLTDVVDEDDMEESMAGSAAKEQAAE
jgi:hypothetical protein